MKTLKKKKYMYTFSFEISLEHLTFKVQSSGGLFTSYGPYKKANITNDLLGVLPTFQEVKKLEKPSRNQWKSRKIHSPCKL